LIVTVIYYEQIHAVNVSIADVTCADPDTFYHRTLD